MKPKVSIIIRTKNEERWITSCLKSIYSQTFKNFEIILVDNFSTDNTVKKSQQNGVKKIIKIRNYYPGKSLNLGIKKSSGDYIVCLSAHCVPKRRNWLQNLINSILESPEYAGVYGRQEPMNFSSNSDKRDLFLVFGLDRKVQIKDTFFHNANSIIRKSVWNKIKFDEKTTNIEDRIWAGKVIKNGWKILYEPKASVFHYHGIHQDGNSERLNNVINIIKKNNFDFSLGAIKPEKLNVLAIIPSKGNSKFLGKKPLISSSINSAKKSKFVKKIYVSTDNKRTLKIAKKLGVNAILRPKNLSKPKVTLEKVQKYSLLQIEKKEKQISDLVVHLEETFPFRDENLIDEVIKNILESGYDTVVAAKEENGCMWKQQSNEKFIRIDEGYIPREFKKKTFIGLHGLCCVTYPEIIRSGKLEGKNVGLYKVENLISAVEMRFTKKFNKFKKIF